MHDPVLRFNLERGWREASWSRRRLVVAFPFLVVAWAVLPSLGGSAAGINDVSAVLGGFSFYAVARVLRPHEGREPERVVRHSLASLAMSCATNFFVLIAFAQDAPGPTSGVGVLIATLGLITTLPWGIVSCIVRSVRVTAQPRTWPSPVTT